MAQSCWRRTWSTAAGFPLPVERRPGRGDSGRGRADGRPNVLWLGGSACSGKTTIASRLAARYRIELYSCDQHFEAHRERADPRLHPAFCRLAARPSAELWRAPVESRVEELLAFYRDEFGMILEDLALRCGAPVLVEGVGLLPELVMPHCRGRGEALWLVSTATFRRRTYPARGGWVGELLGASESPDVAFESWMARDDGLATSIVAAAGRVGARVVGVDGRSTRRRTAQRVARHFGLSGLGRSEETGSRRAGAG